MVTLWPALPEAGSFEKSGSLQLSASSELFRFAAAFNCWSLLVPDPESPHRSGNTRDSA